jgi:hypothetical protein
MNLNSKTQTKIPVWLVVAVIAAVVYFMFYKPSQTTTPVNAQISSVGIASMPAGTPAECQPVWDAILAPDGKGNPKLWDARTMLAIVRAESGCQADIVSKPNLNGTVDKGWFQLNSSHPGIAPSHYSSAIDSSNHAYGIFLKAQERDGIGYTAWSSYGNGRYKQFLK